MNRGTVLILLMISAGVAAGVLKVLQQHRHMDQVLASLSPRVVRLVAEASQAEAIQIQPQAAEQSKSRSATLKIAGQIYQIVDRKSVVGAKGFADVRDRLVADESYNWPPSGAEGGTLKWLYVLRFTDEDGHVDLAFSIPNQRHASIKLLGDGPTLDAHPIADGLATFFAAQFEETAGSANSRK
jgi:hypothetical protein